jgi:hypothetical protein
MDNALVFIFTLNINRFKSLVTFHNEKTTFINCSVYR